MIGLVDINNNKQLIVDCCLSLKLDCKIGSTDFKDWRQDNHYIYYGIINTELKKISDNTFKFIENMYHYTNDELVKLKSSMEIEVYTENGYYQYNIINKNQEMYGL